MNKTDIEWCDYTWNPVTGCLHGCSYCYARKIATRFSGTKAFPTGFKPEFHPDRLNEPLKKRKASSIFVVSMGDLFGKWVPEEWVNRTLSVAKRANWHTYLFLTKDPLQMRYAINRWLEFPATRDELIEMFPNWWFGTTVTGRDAEGRIENLRDFPHRNLFVSFEPLITRPAADLSLCNIKQTIVGAQTNPNVKPQQEWLNIVTTASRHAHAKVFFKDSIDEWYQRADSPRSLCWKVNK